MTDLGQTKGKECAQRVVGFLTRGAHVRACVCDGFWVRFAPHLRSCAKNHPSRVRLKKTELGRVVLSVSYVYVSDVKSA